MRGVFWHLDDAFGWNLDLAENLHFFVADIWLKNKTRLIDAHSSISVEMGVHKNAVFSSGLFVSLKGHLYDIENKIQVYVPSSEVKLITIFQIFRIFILQMEHQQCISRHI